MTRTICCLTTSITLFAILLFHVSPRHAPIQSRVVGQPVLWVQEESGPICCCCLPDTEMGVSIPETLCDILEGSCGPLTVPCGPCGGGPKTGGCCLETGCSMLTENECDKAGGEFDADSDCPRPCAGLGACFVDGMGCLITAGESDTLKGDFAGEGTMCGDFGPCYSNKSFCVETTSRECQEMGGLFGGPNQTCDQPGVCELPDGTCQDLSEDACAGVGTFVPNGMCSDYGPCQRPNGECTNASSSECQSQGGVWGGPGCQCKDLDCICQMMPDSPICELGACRNVSDLSMCEVVRRSECAAFDTVFCGEGTSCDEACDPEASCCFMMDGVITCDVLTAEACATVNGVYSLLQPSCDVPEPCIGGFLTCDEYTLWTGGAGTNDITDPGNWDAREAPTQSGDAAAFQSSGSVILSLQSAVSLSKLRIFEGTLGFLFGGNPLSLGFSQFLCHDLILGGAAGLTAGLDISGGSIDGPAIVSAGTATGSTGVIGIGPGGSLSVQTGANLSGEVLLGAAPGSVGLLTIESGGRLLGLSSICVVGQGPMSHGEFVIQDAGSTASLITCVVGSNGNGALDVTGGGRLTTTILNIAQTPSGTGSVMIDSSVTQPIDVLNVGVSGTGSMVVDGTTIMSDAASTLLHTIGQEPSAVGSLTFQNGARWEAGQTNGVVGPRGQGSLFLRGGSVMECLNFGLGTSGTTLLEITQGSRLDCQIFLGSGTQTGGTANIVVDGPQSTLNMQDTPKPDYVLDFGSQGTAVINLTNGATMNLKGNVAFGRIEGGQGTLIVNDATASFDGRLQFGGLSADSLVTAGRGMASVANGGILNVNGPLHLRAMNDSQFDNELLIDGTVGIPGVVSTDELRVGRSGIVRVTAGGQLITDVLAALGAGDGSFVNPARVVVDGVASEWDAAIVKIGELLQGIPGELTVRNGGRVDSGLINVGPAGTLRVNNGGRVQTALLTVNGTIEDPDQAITIGGTPSPALEGEDPPGIFVTQLEVEPGAILDVPQIDLLPGGVLGGSGEVGFDLFNDGILNPGTENQGTAELAIGGNYDQLITGQLHIDLDVNGAFDSLAVGGTASLAGTLVIRRIDCATIDGGQSFAILTAQAIEGQFDDIDAPNGFVVAYEADRVVLSLEQTIYDADCVAPFGVIDVEDLIAVILSWDEDNLCDLDGNGVVNEDDLMIVIDAWGPCH